MFPSLLKMGPLTIYSYGVFLVLAFLTSLFFVWRKGREEHFEEEELLDGSFWVLTFGLIGARLVYIFIHLEKFRASFWQWFNFSRVPGLNFWGGILAGGLGLGLWAKKKKWPFFKIADVGAIGIIFGQVLARLGDFFGGSFYGKPTSLPWGIRFPDLLEKRHPVQLYEAFLFFLIGWGLLRLEKEYRSFEWYRDKRGETRPGLIFVAWLIGVSLTRFLTGFWLEPGKVIVFGLKIDQLIAFGLIVLGIGLLANLSGVVANINRPLRSSRIKAKRKAEKRIKKGIDLVKNQDSSIS